MWHGRQNKVRPAKLESADMRARLARAFLCLHKNLCTGALTPKLHWCIFYPSRRYTAPREALKPHRSLKTEPQKGFQPAKRLTHRAWATPTLLRCIE